MWKRLKYCKEINIIYLNIGFTRETDKHEEGNWNNVVVETGPIVNPESRDKGTHQHEENCSRSKDRAAHQHELVNDVGHGDVRVHFDCPLVVHQKIANVGHRGGHPATTLVVKLVKPFGTVRLGITGGGVLDTVASLKEQRTQPSILPLIVLRF